MRADSATALICRQQQDRKVAEVNHRVVCESGGGDDGIAIGVLEPMPSTELSCLPGEAEPEPTTVNVRHWDEIELMELVKQQLGRILRPLYHAGRGRTVAGVHHRAVCESGGGSFCLVISKQPKANAQFLFDILHLPDKPGMPVKGTTDRLHSEISFLAVFWD